MLIKGITDEDFVNYKLPAMYIIMPHCSFKCDAENGTQVCQNWSLAKMPSHEIDTQYIVHRYASNPITKAIVFGGLEPFDSFDEMLELIRYCRESWFYTNNSSLACVRSHITDDIVIYTGYNKDEIADKIDRLKQYDNIVVKFGRFVPGQQQHFDPVLGVYLASDNQYAERISVSGENND